jgi:hypothetical protein
LEKSKEAIQREIYQQKEAENNQLRDKVNRKLAKGSLFTPSEKGQTLEQATENLLDKQQQLENQIQTLRNEIQQKERESETLKKDLNAELKKKGQDLREAVTNTIKEKCHNAKYIPTTSDKCLQVATSPFR